MQWLLSDLNPMLSSKTYPKMAMAKSRAKKSKAVCKNAGVTVLRVSMSLGHPQVPVGLYVGNPQI